MRGGTEGFRGRAVVCGAGALVARQLAGMQGDRGQAPASLEIRELVLLGEDGSHAATLGLQVRITVAASGVEVRGLAPEGK